MPTKKENAFREGLQDNTVRLTGMDPKPSVTNNDKHVTNEDDQQIITEEVDDHGEAEDHEIESPVREEIPGMTEKKQGARNIDAENLPPVLPDVRPVE